MTTSANWFAYDRVIDANGQHTDTYKDALGRATKTVYDDTSFTQTLYSVGGQAIGEFDLTPTIPPGGSEQISIAQRKSGDVMSSNFLPKREAELVTWSTNFKTKITATPTAYGLSAPQATAYGGLHDAFVAAYQTANNPDTRSPSSIIAKDMARDVLANNARLLARIVQATPIVTAQQKSDLGLSVRDTQPSPIPPPADAPAIVIESAAGNTVRIRLIDKENPARRGKPAGVDGASVFSFVGAAAPAEEADWTFEGNTTRTGVGIVFPATVAPGAKVWFTARLTNTCASRGLAWPGSRRRTYRSCNLTAKTGYT